VRLDDGTFILRPASLSASRLAGFFGTWEGPAISLEEMDAAIARGAATA